MWALLSQKSQITIAIGVGLVTAWARDATHDLWTGSDGSILKWGSLTVFIVGAVLIPLANKTWRPLWRRVPILSHWIFPDLTGRWKGTLTSTWENPETKAKLAPIVTTITIRQGLFSTAVSLETGETPVSHSRHCVLEVIPKRRVGGSGTATTMSRSRKCDIGARRIKGWLGWSSRPVGHLRS